MVGNDNDQLTAKSHHQIKMRSRGGFSIRHINPYWLKAGLSATGAATHFSGISCKIAVVEVELCKLEHVGGAEPQVADADVDPLGVGGPSEARIVKRCGIVGQGWGRVGVGMSRARG